MDMWPNKSLIGLLWLGLVLDPHRVGGRGATPHTGPYCHSALDAPLQVTEQQCSQDIHFQKGLTCASCHGGDPTSDSDAMSKKAGFRGKIERKDIPGLCA